MKALKVKLKEANMKQKELAARCGVPAAVVSAHTRRGVQTLRVAKRYAAVLGCDPLELLG